MHATPLLISSFKQSFSTNVNALKRRFSSGDLSSEQEDVQIGPDGKPIPGGPGPSSGQQQHQQQPQPTSGGGSVRRTSGASVSSQSGSSGPPGDLSIRQGSSGAMPSTGPSSKTTSAPTSPSKSGGAGGFLQRVQSLTGAAKEMTSNITSQVIASANQFQHQQSQLTNRLPPRAENCLILLVIDDANTDWSKYFKGKKVNELEVKVEQAEFNEISAVAGSDFGCVVSYPVWKDGAKIIKSFQPDFLLVRQNLRDAGRDHKNLLLSFMYGGLPSVNNLSAVYNFQDKPWVFAHMMNYQRKQGKDIFPLIEQYFYPDFKEMATMIPRLPAVLKIGHAHGGLGKIRAGNLNDYQDASSVVAVTGTYCTSEPYVESRCDVHVQKIGNQYKAFMRKGIVGHWKSGSGSAMLEQIPMNERYKSWVDSVATLFGGLDICALEILVGKDGREYIIEVNDSALTLMGESQEVDRRHIAELVLSRMQLLCKPPPIQSSQSSQQMQSQPSSGQRYRRPSGSSVSDVTSVTSSMQGSEGVEGSSGVQGGSQSSVPMGNAIPGVDHSTSAPPPRRDSQSSIGSKSGGSLFGRQNSQPGVGKGSSGGETGAPHAGQTSEDTEDTMKNLRKTFAGIFGDM